MHKAASVHTLTLLAWLSVQLILAEDVVGVAHIVDALVEDKSVLIPFPVATVPLTYPPFPIAGAPSLAPSHTQHALHHQAALMVLRRTPGMEVRAIRLLRALISIKDEHVPPYPVVMPVTAH